MNSDEVATLLVKLYADYKCANGNRTNEDSERYAKAVGIAIKALTNCRWRYKCDEKCDRDIPVTSYPFGTKRFKFCVSESGDPQVKWSE